METDISTLSKSQLEQIGQTLLRQVEAGEWVIKICSQFDIDYGSDQAGDIYGIEAKNSKKSSYFKMWPKFLYGSNIFSMTVGGDTFYSKHIPDSEGFRKLLARMESRVDRYEKALERLKRKTERAASLKSKKTAFEAIMTALEQ